MIRVFPIGELGTASTKNAAGKLCPTKVWYRDDFLAPRGKHLHEAIDIFAPEGSEVLAPDDGDVIDVDEGKGGHHLRLYCQTANGVGLTWYMSHFMERPVVRVGERIEAGALLGLVGRTGNARRTCPHLHARLARGRDKIVVGKWRRGGPAINPYARLREAPWAP